MQIYLAVLLKLWNCAFQRAELYLIYERSLVLHGVGLLFLFGINCIFFPLFLRHEIRLMGWVFAHRGVFVNVVCTCEVTQTMHGKSFLRKEKNMDILFLHLFSCLNVWNVWAKLSSTRRNYSKITLNVSECLLQFTIEVRSNSHYHLSTLITDPLNHAASMDHNSNQVVAIRINFVTWSQICWPHVLLVW